MPEKLKPGRFVRLSPQALKGRQTFLAPSAVAARKGVCIDTVHVAIHDGTLPVAAVIIMGDGTRKGGPMTVSGIAPEIAANWRPRRAGRPTNASKIQTRPDGWNEGAAPEYVKG